jgi:Uncharacterized protein family UPF0016
VSPFFVSRIVTFSIAQACTEGFYFPAGSELGKLKLTIEPSDGESTPPEATGEPPLIEVGVIRIGYKRRIYLMEAFITSFVFVVLAEMGDKTQLLAMAFATRYRWQTVMWGIFAATLVNHLAAVFAGSYLAQLVPLNYIQIVAAVSFIIFGLWTIRGDTLEGEKTGTAV